VTNATESQATYVVSTTDLPTVAHDLAELKSARCNASRCGIGWRGRCFVRVMPRRPVNTQAKSNLQPQVLSPAKRLDPTRAGSRSGNLVEEWIRQAAERSSELADRSARRQRRPT
jgi:hypothetical protein